MTCNPAIASCLEATTILESSTALAPELSSSTETALLCGSPAPDRYVAGGPSSLRMPVGAASMLSLFRDAAPVSDPESHLPPLDADLRLSDYRNEFPSSMRPYVNLLERLETEFGVPVSFRIVQVQLSNGETVPQVVFYRTGDTPDLPSFGGSGGGPLRPGAETPSPTTLGLTVSLVGGAAAIVAFDRLVLDGLIDNGLAPAEARAPLMFAGVMTAHLALYRLGRVSTSPVQGLIQAPTFMGFQILASLLLERLGVDMSSPGGEFASLALSSMPFLLARQSPMIADALSAASAGRGLTLAELETLGTGAATLRAGALFARALGWLGVIDMGSRGLTWTFGNAYSALSTGGYEDNMRRWNLIRMSQDLLNQEDCGAVLAGTLGMFATFSDVLLTAVDGEYEEFYDARMEAIQDTLVGGSDEFGDSLQHAIVAIIARHTAMETGTAPETDWDAVREDIRDYYQDEENAEAIRAGYELVDDATAPLTDSGIRYLIDVVDEDGEISDMDDFRSHFRVRLNQWIFESERRIEERSLELGLMEDVNGVRLSRIPADPAALEAFRATLTPAQRDFVDGEGLQLSLEVFLLSTVRTALVVNS